MCIRDRGDTAHLCGRKNPGHCRRPDHGSGGYYGGAECGGDFHIHHQPEGLVYVISNCEGTEHLQKRFAELNIVFAGEKETAKKAYPVGMCFWAVFFLWFCSRGAEMCIRDRYTPFSMFPSPNFSATAIQLSTLSLSVSNSMPSISKQIASIIFSPYCWFIKLSSADPSAVKISSAYGKWYFPPGNQVSQRLFSGFCGKSLPRAPPSR